MIQKNVTLYVRSPVYSFLIPGALLFILWLIAPIDFDYPGNSRSIALAFCLPTTFILGLALGCRRISPAVVQYHFPVNEARRIVNVLSLAGFSGLTLRLWERIAVRGASSLTIDFAENRELIEAGGNGALALMGGIFSTALFLLPIYVMLLRNLGDRRWRYLMLILFSAAYPISDILLQGSRSTLVIYIGICLLSAFTLYSIRSLTRYIVLISLTIVALIWAAAAIFAERTEQLGIDPLISTYLSGYSYFAPASSEVLSYLDEEGLNGVGGFVFSLLHFSQYTLHGIYEFFYVAGNINKPTTFGLLNFYIPAKIILALTNGPSPESILNDAVARPGVYTTLFGPLIYDFGATGGIFASFFVGIFAGTLCRMIRHGNFYILPLYVAVHGLLPFAFIVNLFSSGTGQYLVINAIFLCALLAFKIRISKNNISLLISKNYYSN